MTADRTRGVVLYILAAALLAGGTSWWFAAAPPDPRELRTAAWYETVMRLLPDEAGHQEARTVLLPAGAEHDVSAPLGSGEYLVTVVCVGADRSVVRVRLSVAGTDSGQGLRCADDNEPEMIRVSVADELRMRVSVNDAGPVMFRYAVVRYGD